MKKSRIVTLLLLVCVAGVLAILAEGWALGGNACPAHAQGAGSCTFPAMVTQAQEGVSQITAEDAYKQIQSDPNTLVIDVQDAADIASAGTISGAVNISLGSLTYKADNQVPESFRDPRLADHSRPIITTCGGGPLGSLAAKLLIDKGFTNVSALKGGVAAWKEAGYPMQSTARTFPAMVAEAQAAVPAITAEEAYKRVQSDTNTLIIDVRDAADIASSGTISGAVNISLGSLTYKADNQVPESFRDPRLADRTRSIITVCPSGALGSLAAKLLKDEGFTNVSFLKGGVTAWKEAGYPMTSTALTFPAMVEQAMKEVPVLTAEDAYKQIQSDPNTLVIDVQDAADVASSGTVKGAVNISLGSLTYKADNQVPESFRDPRLADRSRPIITTCGGGPVGSLAAKLLKDMGFTKVSALKGGVAAWKEAGYPMQ